MAFALLRSDSRSDGLRMGAFRQMVDNMPVAVMVCDPVSFDIIYINESSKTALKQIEHVLPVPADRILGSCIDIFHKDPSHQRRLLSDPRNLPHNAKFPLGDQWIDLLASAIYDDNGRYVAPMVTWSVITEQVAKEDEANRLLHMLDEMPVNVMLAKRDTVEITYVNKTSLATLKTLEHLLPVTADQVLGSCIDIFHKDPQRIRRILADPANLPHTATINLGDQKLLLKVSALRDGSGEYVGPMVTWGVVTEQVELSNNVSEVVNLVSTAATQLNANATSLTTNADMTRDRATTVASTIEELSSSINEISRQVSHTTEVAREADGAAKQSSEMINGLADTAAQIGSVVTIIQDIAEQTNLLALNATIEAARAGDAGKGFAVVAAEVKALANQTAKATGDISDQIGTIQSATGAAVEANNAITRKIDEINSVTASIASAIEEQNVATQEVNQNITMVSDASSETEGMAKEVMNASSELSAQATQLQAHLQKFLETVETSN